MLLLCGGGIGAVAPGHPAKPASESIAQLAAYDEGARFDAILALVDSGEPGVDKLLKQSRNAEPFRKPGRARAALEFVGLQRHKTNAGTIRKAPPAGMNVILISLDTVRADHLGCYGYHRDTSPVIDALALQGALFERAVTPASWTLPAHMSIFTSLYPSFHGLERSGMRWNVGLAASERTMAQYLKESGFVTAALVGNPFLATNWGFGRGFDVYRQFPATDAKGRFDKAALWLQWHTYVADRGLMPSSFFLFLHFMDAHIPYVPPTDLVKKFPAESTSGEGDTRGISPCAASREPKFSAELDSARAQYDTGIYYIDTYLGRLFQLLADLGLKDSTLLILFSDHGDEFGDHGETGHKQTLYEEVLRVPLIVRFPRLIAPRQRIGGAVSLLDILPTVLEAIGQERPPNLQGISLLPYLRRSGSETPAALSPSRPLFAEIGPLGLEWDMPVHRKAVSTGDQKLIVTYSKDGGLTKELYDLAADPRERCNLYAQRRDAAAVRGMEERLARFIREGVGYRAANGGQEGFEASEELLDQLRSLGYIH